MPFQLYGCEQQSQGQSSLALAAILVKASVISACHSQSQSLERMICVWGKAEVLGMHKMRKHRDCGMQCVYDT
jgi:hypothetical protein